MVGKTFTYLLGSDAATLLFNSKNEELNAEDVYSRLTTPVFGKGVAYDVPNPVNTFLLSKQLLAQKLPEHFCLSKANYWSRPLSEGHLEISLDGKRLTTDQSPLLFPKIFLEQKKMLKTGLNIAHFKKHVEVIEEETIEYFSRWGESGEKSKISINNE